MAYIQDWGMRVQAQPQINTTRRAFLHLSQNENGRMLNIRITDVNIPAGSTAVLAGTKPDGTVYSQAGTLAGNTATFAEDVQMTAVAGTWDAKITVTNGGNCICTARITITIDPDTVAGGAVPSDSQLDGIIAECRAIADSVRKEAYGSPLVADAVEDMTDQSRVYVYTGSESGMTAGHWYYYDGSTWTDGGVYNAVAVDTDTTLSIAGKAADAKEVGDQLADVKEDLGKIDIALPTPQNGYYSGNVGDTISFTSATNSRAYQIDLSAYIGKKVNIKIQSGGTTSSRKTAMCNNVGMIGVAIAEGDIISTPNGVLFDITSDYNQLYASAYANGAGGYTLTVTVISALSLDVLNIQNRLHSDVVYVDGSATTSGDGTKSAPFKTIQEAVNNGAETIKVKAGSYPAFKVENREYPLMIMLDEMPDYQTTPQNDLPKIKITSATGSTGYCGVQIQKCAKISLFDIWVDGVSRYSYDISDVQSLEVVRCYANSNNTSNFSLFRFVNVNGVMRDCVAWDSRMDGFNIHGYGNTEFINCVAYNCDDDGISHHDACTGVILGGEYYGNGKGGVSSPTYGSSVDISDVYSHDNTQYGIYADGGEPSSYPQKVKARISNCVIKNNGTVDIYTKNSELVGWNNIYDTKNIVTEKGGAFTEYS